MKHLLTAFVFLSLSVPAIALDVKFSGSIGTGAWWMRTERFYANPDVNDTTRKVGDSLPMFNCNFLPYGTLATTMKLDNFNVCFELGINENSYDNNLTGSTTAMRMGQKKSWFITAKRWFGEWQVNDNLDFLIGRDYTPANFFPSNQAFWKENGFSNIGCLYTGRTPMFQVALHDAGRSLEGKIAAIQVDTTVMEIPTYSSGVGQPTKYLCETTLPKFEGSFGLNKELGPVALQAKVAGGYETYKTICFNDNLAAKESKSKVDAWLGGGFVTAKLGMVSLSCASFYGQNIGNYGVKIGDEFSWWRVSDFLQPFYAANEPIDPMSPNTTFKMRNGKALEVAAMLNLRPVEMFSFEAGGGTVRGTHEVEAYNNVWDPTYAWYAQAELTLRTRLKVVPEVGQYIWGPRGGFGRYIYWGLNTRIDID